MNARPLLHAAALLAACAMPAVAEPRSRGFAEFETSLQLTGRVGYGTWSDGDTATFFPGASGPATGTVGAGLAYGGELLYRFSPGFALGLSGPGARGTRAAPRGRCPRGTPGR